MSAAMRAMTEALAALHGESHPKDLMPFAELRERVGFEAYYADEQRYAGARD
jgi:hypothetical protein